MIRFAQSPAIAFNRPARAPCAGPFAALRRHLARIQAAHEYMARRDRLSAHDLCDTGLGPEDILGENTYAADLPFFFRPGFGRR